jgi:hypothetical protein
VAVALDSTPFIRVRSASELFRLSLYRPAPASDWHECLVAKLGASLARAFRELYRRERLRYQRERVRAILALKQPVPARHPVELYVHTPGRSVWELHQHVGDSCRQRIVADETTWGRLQAVDASQCPGTHEKDGWFGHHLLRVIRRSFGLPLFGPDVIRSGFPGVNVRIRRSGEPPAA